MDLFTYLLKKKGHNSSVNGDLFSYLLASRKRGTYQTYNGTQINVVDSINARMKNWILGGNSNQNGTPTPNAPIDIHNVIGENNVIENSGKNLYEPIASTLSTNGLTSKIENDGSLSVSGTATKVWSNVCADTDIYLQAGTYTFSLSKTYTYSCCVRCYTNKEKTTYQDMRINAGQTKNAKTFTSNIYGWRFYIEGFAIDDEINDNFKIQIEVGNEATPFEKYKGKNYKISLSRPYVPYLNIELCKIGDYQDKIYKQNDKWYLEKNVGKYTAIESTGYWYLSGANHCFKTLLENTPISNIAPYNFNNSLNIGAFNRLLKQALPNDLYLGNEGNAFGLSNTQSVGIYFRIYGIDTIEDFINWLNTNQPVIYYAYATPVITEITDDNLINQLEELAKARSFDEQTNITQLSEQLPFDLTVDIKTL